jgi:hypothetical protein
MSIQAWYDQQRELLKQLRDQLREAVANGAPREQIIKLKRQIESVANTGD